MYIINVTYKGFDPDLSHLGQACSAINSLESQIPSGGEVGQVWASNGEGSGKWANFSEMGVIEDVIPPEDLLTLSVDIPVNISVRTKGYGDTTYNVKVRSDTISKKYMTVNQLYLDTSSLKFKWYGDRVCSKYRYINGSVDGGQNNKGYWMYKLSAVHNIDTPIRNALMGLKICRDTENYTLSPVNSSIDAVFQCTDSNGGIWGAGTFFIQVGPDGAIKYINIDSRFITTGIPLEDKDGNRLPAKSTSGYVDISRTITNIRVYFQSLTAQPKHTNEVKVV